MPTEEREPRRRPIPDNSHDGGWNPPPQPPQRRRSPPKPATEPVDTDPRWIGTGYGGD